MPTFYKTNVSIFRDTVQQEEPARSGGTTKSVVHCHTLNINVTCDDRELLARLARAFNLELDKAQVVEKELPRRIDHDSAF